MGIWHYKKIWVFHSCSGLCIVTSAILYFCYNLYNPLQVKNIIPTWRHVLIMFVLNYSFLRATSVEFDFGFTLGLLCQGYIFVMNHLHWEKKNLLDLNGVFVYNVAEWEYLDKPYTYKWVLILIIFIYSRQIRALKL